MSLATQLATHKPSKPGPKCALGRTLAEMKPDDAALLQAALDDEYRYGHMALFRILRAEGWIIGRDAIARHRRGDCSCGSR